MKSLSANTYSVSIVSNSGDPRSGAYLQIRGQNSITGSTQPLFVVDGVLISSDELGSNVDGVGQQSGMNDINLNDIISRQILKGASTATLWGYRASNGDVLITTRKEKIYDDISSTFLLTKQMSKWHFKTDMVKVLIEIAQEIIQTHLVIKSAAEQVKLTF